jgi:hypothetical protein
MKLFGVRTTRERSALALLILMLSWLLPTQSSVVRADDPAGGAWVLTETLVNPFDARTEFRGGGSMPDWFSEPRFEGKQTTYTVSDSSFSVEDREVDREYEYHNVNVQVSFQQPPAQLVAGETIELAATFSHGGSVHEGGTGIGFLFWYSSEDETMQPKTAFGYSPWHPNFDGTSSATYTYQVPEAYDGGELELYASLWNMEPCLVIWRYRAEPAKEEQEKPAPEEEDKEEPEEETRRPIIILPGIYGSYLASVWDQHTWIYNRGLHPDLLAIDPLAHFYDDIIATLKNAGYVVGEDLFIGAYDWRMAPGPFDGTYDGVIQGISGLSITDDRYEYGVDYLGHQLKQAAERWQQNHDGEILDGVDIISHSTGGLVARTYIQSTAYGQHFPADGGGIPLPRVNNLIMVAVPNRGAALPWQAMHNNFIRDAASKFVMSKILANSYYKIQKGMRIDGPAGPITPDGVRDPDTGSIDPARFINQYCPTFRSLLATYPFLIDRQGNLVTVNDSPEVRNDLLLDLNNGLDLPDRPDSGDPNGFADRVKHTAVIYATHEPTAHQVREMDTAASNVVFPMDAIFEKDVADGTIWYQDIIEPVGDGTVPHQSSAGQFAGDGRIEVIRIHEGEGNTTHTGLMGNPRVQKVILDILEIDRRELEISSGLAVESPGNIIMAVTDPVGFLLVDGQGRRLGWTEETSILTEIPGSVWYGEGDGIGVVYGDVEQPLRVELVGLGDDHLLQVAGLQSQQRVGLEDSGSLAPGETRSVEVEIRDRLGPPDTPPESAPDPSALPDEPAGLLSGPVLLLVLALGGLVLVVVVLMLLRRRGARSAGG